MVCDRGGEWGGVGKRSRGGSLVPSCRARAFINGTTKQVMRSKTSCPIDCSLDRGVALEGWKGDSRSRTGSSRCSVSFLISKDTDMPWHPVKKHIRAVMI